MSAHLAAHPTATLTTDSNSPEPVQFSGGLGFGKVCNGVGAANAAPYRGAGPHLIDFEGDATLQSVGNQGFGIVGGLIADGGSGGGSNFEPYGWDVWKASRVQLVGCITEDLTSKPVGTCHYDEGGAPLDEADYTITLYVARTGQQLLGPDTVRGTVHSCPDMAVLDADQPAVYTSLSIPRLAALISKYVD
jgi:hypothetical protein